MAYIGTKELRKVLLSEFLLWSFSRADGRKYVGSLNCGPVGFSTWVEQLQEVLERALHMLRAIFSWALGLF